MEIIVDNADSRPVYRQVADEIKGLIAQGRLGEGDALPTVRQLAADLGVNMNTIATAYRELQEEGLIQIKHGAGAKVAARHTTAKARPSADKLRRGLRPMLASMLLSGLRQEEILKLVNGELRAMRKGAKG